MDVYNLIDSLSAFRFGAEFPLGSVAVILAGCVSLVVARKIIAFMTGF